MAALAPPTPSKGPANRLRKPVPVPAGLRPKRNEKRLPLMNLFKVPKRLLVPPRATGVGSVRSFKSTPLGEVKLADVMAGKHLSPLSLKDFEGYLVYREHSAENLYFLLWLNEYTKEWQAWNNDSSATKTKPEYNPNTDPNADRYAAHLPDYLATSLQQGIAMFIAPNGALELNLSENTRQKTLVGAGNSGDPADFAEARRVIEDSLKQSLAGHARNCVANAGPRRLVFCFCLGVTVFLLGLVAPFVAIFGNYARAYRTIGLPFILLGSWIAAMALKRICGVIWLLGEDRQLQSWELCTPTLTSGTLVSLNCPSTPRSVSSSWDEESTIGDNKESFRSANSSDPYPWEKEERMIFGNEQHAMSTVTFETDTAVSSRPPSYTKSSSYNLVPDSPPVWGSVTTVYNPDVTKAQWALVIQALGWGVITLLIVGTVLMAVPNQG